MQTIIFFAEFLACFLAIVIMCALLAGAWDND